MVVIGTRPQHAFYLLSKMNSNSTHVFEFLYVVDGKIVVSLEKNRVSLVLSDLTMHVPLHNE